MKSQISCTYNTVLLDIFTLHMSELIMSPIGIRVKVKEVQRLCIRAKFKTKDYLSTLDGSL